MSRHQLPGRNHHRGNNANNNNSNSNLNNNAKDVDARDPTEIRKQVESMIRMIGGPNSSALIDRHPHALKRGAVLVKAPHNDCLQRAVEKVEARLRAGDMAAGITGAGSATALLKAEATAAHATAAAAGTGIDLNDTMHQHAELEKQDRDFDRTAVRGAANRGKRAFSASVERTRRAAPSPNRGAVLSFKSNARLFLGKAFPCGAVDSPGPIYQQHGDGINTNNGRSFGRARRESPPKQATTAGPGYQGASSLGRQFTSNHNNQPTVFIGKTGRFGEIKENERTKNRGGKRFEVPGPGSYISDIEHIPHHIGGRIITPSPSLGVRHSQNQFISKTHFADLAGRSSPGPAYDVSNKHRGVFPPSRAPSFGKGERIPLERTEKVPGPGAYSAAIDDLTTTGEHRKDIEKKSRKVWVGFAKSRRMQNKDNGVPGPIYEPHYEVTRPNLLADVKIGNGPEEDAEKDEKFQSKLFLGKGLGVDTIGRDSPGPQYNPAVRWDGPSYKLTFKEPRVRPSLFPRPQRARWISEQSAKENLGAYSPGPKYNTTGDISKTGVVFSFGGGSTNRELLDESSASAASAGSGGGKRGTSASQKDGNGGKGGGGGAMRSTNTGTEGHPDSASQSAVPFYDSNYAYLSTTKPIHSVVISPVTKKKLPGEIGRSGGSPSSPSQQQQQQQQHHSVSSRKSGAGSGDEKDDQQQQQDTRPFMYYPKDKVCHPAQPVFSFGKGDRSSSIWKVTDDRSNKFASLCGQTSQINYSQVERQYQSPHLGGLSAPG